MVATVAYILEANPEDEEELWLWQQGCECERMLQINDYTLILALYS
jgi:hypothetical protein